jgi:hypothetical protein
MSRSLTAALAALLLAVPASAEAAAPNKDPKFLNVVDANVENLPAPGNKCPGRWQNLVAYLHRQKLAPDLLTIEQISNRKQLDAYTAVLSQNLPGTYRGVIAKANPKPMKSPCGYVKRLQTNAIVYRVGRLSPVGNKATWQADHKTAKGCRNNTQDRSIAVRQLFLDKRANKIVSAGVVHWPTAQSGGTPCASENARETLRVMTRKPAHLQLFGGDFNIPPSRGTWYRRVAKVFKDAICPGNGASCNAKNWTIGGPGNHRRIDMLWARRGDGTRPKTTARNTISSAEAGGRYSDHRAIHARIYY